MQVAFAVTRTPARRYASIASGHVERDRTAESDAFTTSMSPLRNGSISGAAAPRNAMAAWRGRAAVTTSLIEPHVDGSTNSKRIRD
ncbi:hypothetical protein ACFWDA_18165 [Rhodococcus zopfii]|uniref:hypothetical protein n=1 Tax=Rhodococcus zopfii TaxID=43772 RepID=UPI000932D599|nr:hypothetical protein [Rhodococcus zopfii]